MYNLGSPLLQCEEQLSCSCAQGCKAGSGLCFAKQNAVIELRTCRELTDEGWGWDGRKQMDTQARRLFRKG